MSEAAERYLRAAQIALQAGARLGCTTCSQCLPLALGDVRLGRPRYDDEGALRQIRALQANGHKHAITAVARALAGGGDHELVGRRLRGKIRVGALR